MEHPITQRLAHDHIYYAGVMSFERLSKRLFQEMSAVISGREMNEIAKRLSLSLEEIHDYRRELLNDLGVSTKAELELLIRSFSQFGPLQL